MTSRNLTEKKPVWYNSDFPYELAKWIHEHRIIRIDHDWKMTGADTADYWAVMVADNKETRRMPVLNSLFVEFRVNHRGLVHLTPYCSDEVRKIIKWEKTHKQKINEFNKLKEELGM